MSLDKDIKEKKGLGQFFSRKLVDGINQRDFIALTILHALHSYHGASSNVEGEAEYAYKMTDAMLEQREK